MRVVTNGMCKQDFVHVRFSGMKCPGQSQRCPCFCYWNKTKQFLLVAEYEPALIIDLIFNSSFRSELTLTSLFPVDSPALYVSLRAVFHTSFPLSERYIQCLLAQSACSTMLKTGQEEVTCNAKLKADHIILIFL